jgi:hypothetical protein
MTKADLSVISTDDLVQRFAEITRAQDKAILAADYSKYNRLFKDMICVADELRRRPGDQRRALVPLYEFPNMQVRLKAAIHTLAVTPAEARAQLQAIAEAHWFPQTADAAGMLRALDEGRYVPA